MNAILKEFKLDFYQQCNKLFNNAGKYFCLYVKIQFNILPCQKASFIYIKFNKGQCTYRLLIYKAYKVKEMYFIDRVCSTVRLRHVCSHSAEDCCTNVD